MMDYDDNYISADEYAELVSSSQEETPELVEALFAELTRRSSMIRNQALDPAEICAIARTISRIAEVVCAVIAPVETQKKKGISRWLQFLKKKAGNVHTRIRFFGKKT